MSIFNRKYEKIEDKRKKKEEREEGLKKLKEEKLSNKDVIALIAAMFQLVAPFAAIALVIYFVVIYIFVNL